MAMEQTTGAPRKNPATDFDYDSDSELPFPEPLPRQAFLESSFTPQNLLETLTSRHQTLSDLRSELSSRSQTIASELLTLVNNEYQAFLGLGQDLKGGGEKVEEVKLGVLGLAKGVNGLKSVVKQREDAVKVLLKEREAITLDISFGRALLRIADDIDELEEALALGSTKTQETWSDEDQESDVDEDEVAVALMGYSRLQRLVHQFARTKTQVERLGGTSQPFLGTQQERLQAIHGTLLIDLGTALKQAKEAGVEGRLLKLMTLYAKLDDAAEALRVLRELANK